MGFGASVLGSSMGLGGILRAYLFCKVYTPHSTQVKGETPSEYDQEEEVFECLPLLFIFCHLVVIAALQM